MLTEALKERLQIYDEKEARIMESLLIVTCRAFSDDNEAFVDLLNSAKSQLMVMSMLYHWVVRAFDQPKLERIEDQEVKKRIAATATYWCKPGNGRRLIYFYRAAYVFHIVFNVKKLD